MRGLMCVGKIDVRVNELADGSFGLANGFLAGEGPVGARTEGTSVVIFRTLGVNRTRLSWVLVLLRVDVTVAS